MPQTRRALLGGALAGLGALAATALGRPQVAAGAAGDNLKLGQSNSSGSAQTVLTNTGAGAAFTLKTTNASTGAAGIFGWSSSTGSNPTRGLYGRADGPHSHALEARQMGAAGTGAAVNAAGGNNVGVVATTQNGSAPALLATNQNGNVAGAGGHAIRGFSGGGGVSHVHPGGQYADAAAEFAGYSGVIGASTGSGIGVFGLSTGNIAVYGRSEDASGVLGESVNEHGVRGVSAGGNGVSGSAYGGRGVDGTSVLGNGVFGTSTDGVGVYGTSANGPAIKAVSLDHIGVQVSSGGYGVYAVTTGAYAAVSGYAEGATGEGVVGTSINNYGIYGHSANNYSGYFLGGLYASSAHMNVKAFKIDHPQDPANKVLMHSCVESNERKLVYDGRTTTDAKGEAAVKLPGYFDALNTDVRYQLTVIGSFAQAIVTKEVAGNRFTIATSEPNVAVSWQVTGVRQDAYSKAHPLEVETVKTGKAKGKYLNPVEHGQPEARGIDYDNLVRARTKPTRT